MRTQDDTLKFESTKSVPIRDDTLRFEPLTSVPIRRWGQWTTAAVILVLLAAFIFGLATNKRIHWTSVGEHLVSPDVLGGVLVTLELTVICMLLGTALGVLLAMARMSSNRVLQAFSSIFIWFFRGIPLLVLILICGNWGIISQNIGIGIPFTDIMFLSVPTRDLVTPFLAAVVALSLHEAAYMAEVVRGGVLGVDRGQAEAARALGMSDGMAMRRIVLPQSMRIIIPPTGNQLITMVKSTALVEVIAGQELMTVVTSIGYNTYRVIEALFVATFWYLIIIGILSVGQHFLEKHFGKGDLR
ncbi:MAG: amino acid ABC transporter permease [Actinomycetota bacterium]